MYPFVYYVTYWDDKDKLKDQGITFGETLAAAMANIAEYYGDKAIDRVTLVGVEDAQAVMPLTEAEVERLERRAYNLYG